MNQSLVAARDTFSCFNIRCLVVVSLSLLNCLCSLYGNFTPNIRLLDRVKAPQMMYERIRDWENGYVSEKVNVKNQVLHRLSCPRNKHSTKILQMMHNQWTNNYLLHQNIQVMFNICFLLFIFQMFYICPRGHLSQNVIFIVFYCVQCVKFPFTTLVSEGLTQRSEHTGNMSVWCDVNLYFDKTSDLSMLQTGIFFY